MPKKQATQCLICHRRSVSKGLCGTHYQQHQGADLETIRSMVPAIIKRYSDVRIHADLTMKLVPGRGRAVMWEFEALPWWFEHLPEFSFRLGDPLVVNENASTDPSGKQLRFLARGDRALFGTGPQAKGRHLPSGELEVTVEFTDAKAAADFVDKHQLDLTVVDGMLCRICGAPGENGRCKAHEHYLTDRQWSQMLNDAKSVATLTNEPEGFNLVLDIYGKTWTSHAMREIPDWIFDLDRVAFQAGTFMIPNAAAQKGSRLVLTKDNFKQVLTAAKSGAPDSHSRKEDDRYLVMLPNLAPEPVNLSNVSTEELVAELGRRGL